jgi:NitT/TauT family transport system ATP-binding protein
MQLTADVTAGDAADAPPSRPMVELDGVSLRYGDELALADATMSIPAGSFVAVVGPSGCGKSTLMKLVTGLIPPETGRIVVDGAPVGGPVVGVGMAFQNSTLLPWRTTIDNVMLPLEIVQPFKRDLGAGERKARAMQLLETVGLGKFGDHYPWQLSGGMQQRANLCRAIVHDPKLVMLDEPFAALDAFTKEDLCALMQDLWLRRKFTAILVTHDLREAVFLADCVYVMSARPGRVVYRRPIDLPRPRTQEMAYGQVYLDHVHALRAKIAEVRKE